MVVDYRKLNRVTQRKVFLIPNSDLLKASVAGSRYLSAGDLKEGFNQCDNEPEASQKMAVIVPSGIYLPKGLTFGPTNGPEDFQELMFTIFSRGLYKEWWLFLDDLTVATGTPSSLAEGPSGVQDVVCVLRERGAGPVLGRMNPYGGEGPPPMGTSHLEQLAMGTSRLEQLVVEAHLLGVPGEEVLGVTNPYGGEGPSHPRCQRCNLRPGQSRWTCYHPGCGLRVGWYCCVDSETRECKVHGSGRADPELEGLGL